MARETGVVIEITLPIPPATVPTKGFVQRDDLTHDPNTPEFNDPTLETRKIILKVDDKVSFEVGDDNIARNIELITTGDPDEPKPYDGITPRDNETISGNLSVAAGQSVVLRACVVTGKIDVGNNSRIIITSHGGGTSRIGKGIKATGAAEVIIYNSEVVGTVVFNNGAKFSAKKGNLQSAVVANSNKPGSVVCDG